MTSDRNQIPDKPGYLPHKRPEDNPGRANQTGTTVRHSAPIKHNPTTKSGHKGGRR